MFYAAVDKHTCLCVVQKVASMSISTALNSFGATQVTAEEALTYRRRIAFIRDPIERVNSVFNHAYITSVKYLGNFGTIAPGGIIQGDGFHVRQGVIANPHRFTEDKRQAYLARVDAAKGERVVTAEALATELDNLDYRNFIDHILSGGKDPHWDSQRSQLTHNGELVPSDFVRFERLADWWAANVPYGAPPWINAYQPIAHDDYKLAELTAFYADDFALRGVAV